MHLLHCNSSKKQRNQEETEQERERDNRRRGGLAEREEAAEGGFVREDQQGSPGTYMWLDVNRITCVEVSVRQRLQDGVHGPHVEDEAQLGHAHGDEAQQEDGAEDALHEGLS